MRALLLVELLADNTCISYPTCKIHQLSSILCVGAYARA